MDAMQSLDVQTAHVFDVTFDKGVSVISQLGDEIGRTRAGAILQSMLLRCPMMTVRDKLSALPNPSDAVSFVLAHGRDFQPKPRPKGLRKRKLGLCYQSALGIALQGNDIQVDGAPFYYVEGFALGHGLDVFIQHAWLTTDGTDAIDPCIPDSSLGTYIGVPFSPRASAQILLARRRHTFFDPIDDVVLSAMAEHPFATP